MTDKIVLTMKQHYEAKIAEHRLNIDIMIANPTSIPEHSNFVAEIDKELSLMSESKDKLETLVEYF
jgi:hypothetical protein